MPRLLFGIVRYDNSPGPGRETHHSAQLQTQQSDETRLIMIDRHQGHSALPYRPAPSCFIHKNRQVAILDSCFFFFFFPFFPFFFHGPLMPDGGPLHEGGSNCNEPALGGPSLQKVENPWGKRNIVSRLGKQGITDFWLIARCWQNFVHTLRRD